MLPMSSQEERQDCFHQRLAERERKKMFRIFCCVHLAFNLNIFSDSWREGVYEDGCVQLPTDPSSCSVGPQRAEYRCVVTGWVPATQLAKWQCHQRPCAEDSCQDAEGWGIKLSIIWGLFRMNSRSQYAWDSPGFKPHVSAPGKPRCLVTHLVGPPQWFVKLFSNPKTPLFWCLYMYVRCCLHELWAW